MNGSLKEERNDHAQQNNAVRNIIDLELRCPQNDPKKPLLTL